MSRETTEKLPNRKLKQPLGFHAEVLVIPDNDVIQDIDADDLPGFHQSFCQADILLGGGNIAGRVIMHKETEDTIIQTHFHSRFLLNPSE